MSRILFLGWRNLFRNLRRTFASLATIALGAAGLLIYQGFNEGIMNQYRENTIRVRYGHGQVFPKGYHEKARGNIRQAWIQDPAKVEKTLLAIPDVVQVFPRVGFYSFIAKGAVRLAGRGEGVRPERESKFFTAMNFESGRDLAQEGELILGRGLANSLDAKPGDTIRLLAQTMDDEINEREYKIAGVFHTGAQDFDNSVFRMHIKSAQKLMKTDRVELFALETTGVDAWPAVEREIRARLPELEAVPFDELDAVYYKNAVAFLNAQFGFIRLIILLIVALGIFNTIMVAMLERAPELGALRANGESRANLFLILLTENAFLGFLGGALGIAVAVLLDKTVLRGGIPMPPGPGITRHFLILLEIQPRHYLQAMFLPMLAAVFSSLWPSLRLLRRKIPDLLRS